MRILVCLALLFSFSTPTFADPAAQPGELERALDRLDVVFEHARTPHHSTWGSLMWGAVSAGALYVGLVRWTGHRQVATDIFNFAVVGNLVWSAGDGFVRTVLDRRIARKERPARDYMENDVLPDFFRLPRRRQLDLVRGNREFEQFLLRLDAALQNTAPVVPHAPAGWSNVTPRTF